MDAARSNAPLLVVDTNVVLDLILGREPFVHNALTLFALAEAEQLALVLSADAISTIGYIVERNKDAQTARAAITNLLGRVKLAPLDEGAVREGLGYDFIDIEDSLVAAVAARSKAVAIVTHNGTDFRNSPVPAVSPAEFLAFWASRES